MRIIARFTLVMALAGVLATTEARAQTTPREGTVVAIDAGELVVDLGIARGVHSGDVVELWRPLRIKHPVTGQMLTDRFRIGTLRLTQVRPSLSIAAIEGAVGRPPATGDIVIVPESAREPAAAPTTKVLTTTTTVVPEDPDAAALAKLMSTLIGATPEMRIRAYESFSRAHPNSRFAAVLNEEAASLRAVATPATPKPRFDASAPRLDRVRAGETQRIAVELDARFVGGVVHVRRKGTPGYRSLPMNSIGPRYWAATLPADAMTASGMEYFVEGVSPDSTVALIGSADAPRQVDVEPEQQASVNRHVGLAQVSLQSEYASFNAKRANDYVFQTEGTVGWRLHDEGIRAVRSGFGVLRGEGGSLEQLDTKNLPPDKVGLTYGYIELEIAMSPNYALIGRPILGLRDEGLTGGAAAFFRIGNDLRTNLLIGGEILGGVGQRAIVELDWRTIKRVPIVLRSEVTTQPSTSGDIGARAIAQIGYEFLPSLAVSARGSYQGRTINHAGPGGGVAVSYQW